MHNNKYFLFLNLKNLIMQKENYLKKFKIVNKLNEDIYVATELYEFFNKNLSFPRIMKIVQENGKQWGINTLNEMKKSHFRNPASFFIWKAKKEKTIFI